MGRYKENNIYNMSLLVDADAQFIKLNRSLQD